MAFPTEVNRARLAWWAIGAVLFVSLIYVVHFFIGTFVFGVFIYYATRPVYRKLHRRIGQRTVSAALAMLALALPALLLLAYTVAVGLQEFGRIAAEQNIGSIEQILQPYLDVASIVRDPESLLEQPSTMAAIQAVIDDALAYLGFIGNALLHLFVMLMIGFYLLRDDQRLADWFRRRFVADDSALQAFSRAVDRDFNNIFFGNILNAVLTGIIGATMYNILAMAAPAGITIPYPTLLGLLTGVASLIPVIGMKLVYFPLTGYLLYLIRADLGLLWFPVAFFAVSFVIVDVIPDLVLRPYVSGRGLHLGMVMLAYIFGPLLFGWYGIFLGPMLLVLIVHFTRLVLPELLLGRPVQPEAVEPAGLGSEPGGGVTEPASGVPAAPPMDPVEDEAESDANADESEPDQSEPD